MKRNTRTRLLLNMFLVAFALCCSCKKAIRTPAEMTAYVNEPKNGLKVSQQAGKIETSVTYKPWQMMALNRGKDTAALHGLKNKLFFVLSLSANHKELLRQLKFSDYSEMVQVLAFRMGDYVSAVPDRGKAVPPEECLFQQTYGMGSANQLLLVFDKAKFEHVKQAEIRIKEFGLNTGNLDYCFNLEDINELQDIALHH